MTEDHEGFLYPNVDENTCISCGLCEKVCNELHPYDTREPLQVLAAINKNEEVRLKSSSGGIFYILAEKTIREGGVVFGARFDEKWQVVIDYAEDMKDVEAFMGSKYVQARIDKAYIDAKRFLSEGRQVLFLEHHVKWPDYVSSFASHISIFFLLILSVMELLVLKYGGCILMKL